MHVQFLVSKERNKNILIIYGGGNVFPFVEKISPLLYTAFDSLPTDEMWTKGKRYARTDLYLQFGRKLATSGAGDR